MQVGVGLGVEAEDAGGGRKADRHHLTACQVKTLESRGRIRNTAAVDPSPDALHGSAFQQGLKVPPTHNRQNLPGRGHPTLLVEKCNKLSIHSRHRAGWARSGKVTLVGSERAPNAQSRGVSLYRHARSREGRGKG